MTTEEKMKKLIQEAIDNADLSGNEDLNREQGSMKSRITKLETANKKKADQIVEMKKAATTLKKEVTALTKAVEALKKK